MITFKYLLYIAYLSISIWNEICEDKRVKLGHICWVKFLGEKFYAIRAVSFVEDADNSFILKQKSEILVTNQHHVIGNALLCKR